MAVQLASSLELIYSCLAEPGESLDQALEQASQRFFSKVHSGKSSETEQAFALAQEIARCICHEQTQEIVDCSAEDLPKQIELNHMPITVVSAQDAVDAGVYLNTADGNLIEQEAYMAAGGTGFNVAHACAKFARKVNYHPIRGLQALTHLQSGYDLHQKQLPQECFKPLRVSTSDSFVFLTLHDEANDREQHFKTAEFELDASEQAAVLNQLDQELSKLEQAGVMVLSDNLPATDADDFLAQAAMLAQNNKQAVFFNPKEYIPTARAQANLFKAKAVNFAKPNLAELAQFAVALGISHPEAEMDLLEDLLEAASEELYEPIVDLATKVIDQAGIRLLIISLGANGTLMLTKTQMLQIKAPKIHARSTVAAGDAGIAGFLDAMIANKINPLAEDFTVEELTKLAISFNSAAAGTVEQPGSNKVSKLRFEELKSIYQSQS